MVTVQARTCARRRPQSLTIHAPLWVWIACSRLIVLAAGAAGALFTRPVSGWERYDPGQLSTSLGSVGNVLSASMFRWDAIGYANIAEQGYRSARSTVLFPLYPLLIRGVGVVVGSPVVAGLLISLVAFGAGLGLVHRIASEEINPRVADGAVLLLGFAPWSFVFSAIYTESLLLAFSALAFFLARKDRFFCACVAAACASLTHIQGILLIAPLGLMYWNRHGRSCDPRRLWSPSLFSLALPPLALGSFFLYSHTRGWAWLAPITSQNVAYAGRTFVGPPVVVFDSVKDVVLGLSRASGGGTSAGTPFPLDVQNLIYVAVFTLAIAALVSTWRRLPKEFALFAGLAILVSASSAVAMEPLKGFDRYVLPIFPLWIGAAAWLEKRRLMPGVIAISTVMLVFYTVEFSRWVSVF